MSLTDEQRRALLEELEAEKRRRIEAKIESGKAVLMPPIVVGAPQSESRTKDDLGREVYHGRRTKEGAIEHLDMIVTGVPRAGRDPEPISAPASAPRTKERQPEGGKYRVHTALGERDIPVTHRSAPKPQPDTSERHHVRAMIAPRSESDPGQILEGSFTVDGGLVRVYDNADALVGSAPHRPGDDVFAIARKLLREKRTGGGFYDPIRYPVQH